MTRTALDIAADFAEGRVSGALMREAAAFGMLRPRGRQVLLQAIHEEQTIHATSVIARTAIDGGAAKLDARHAIAFRVLAVGPKVEDLEVGAIVTQTSATGDVVDHTDLSCPFWLVDEGDVTGVVVF